MYLKFTGEPYGEATVYYFNPDDSMWIWKKDSTYYQTASLGIPLVITGATKTYPSGYLYNSKDYYFEPSSGLFLWYDSVNRYVISSSLGYRLLTTDAWWKCATLTGTYVKQGTAEADKTVSSGQIEGRSNTTLAGVYSPVSGSLVTGDIWVGWKVLEDVALDEEYIQRTQDYFGYETYAADRNLWWNAALSKYVISNVIGTADGNVGFWSCATLTGTYTRTYTGSGTPPTPEEYDLTFKEYRLQSDTHDSYPIYMGQTAVWL